MLGWLERNNIFAWVLVVIIAVGIFYFSSLHGGQGGGGGNPFIPTIYHVSAFFLLALFLFIASLRGEKNAGIIVFAFLVAIFYGISDEIHQIFVPGRSSSLGDVFLDSVGVFYAFMIYAISLQYREIKNGKNGNRS